MLFQTTHECYTVEQQHLRPNKFRIWLGLCLLVPLLSSCGTLSNDPRVRTPGTMLDDQMLESVVKRKISRSLGGLKGAHLVVVSYNGVVLLAGQVASAAIKNQAEQVADAIEQVRRVHNELQVGGPISYIARSNDSWITTKVKSRLLADKHSHANQIKVVTENSVVYLLGTIPRSQASQAVEVAKSVYGVQKIVKVFEYMGTESVVLTAPAEPT
jgi:osmotically-inducible protein OsmY